MIFQLVRYFVIFWIELLNQPRETIKQYYKQNVPNVEEVFIFVEKKYNLTKICPAKELLKIYT